MLEKHLQSISNMAEEGVEKYPHSVSNMAEGVEKHPHSVNNMAEEGVEKYPHSVSNMAEGVEKHPHSVNNMAEEGVEKYPHSVSNMAEGVEKHSHSVNNMAEEGVENSGFRFWRTTLKSCQYVVAPMVDQSELAWRMLSRKYGAELCYTPMLHASLFIKDAVYRRDSLQICPEDRPLIVQFCANDPETLLKAAKLVEPLCDAIDLNLGCPQVIAKKGHYGAFLQDEWDLLARMVRICHENLKVPITCKVRIFPSVEKTVEYAKMLEEAGCQLLTVHGRTREQKGRLTGVADWSYIKAVREAVKIPVFANGNIQYLSDVHRCLQETGAQGVMSAEGNLHNPALFSGKSPNICDITMEYLNYTDLYPCPLSYIRGHVFKICHHALTIHRDVRDLVASAKSVEDIKIAAEKLKVSCQADIDRYELQPELFTTKLKLPLPYWICQPYVRPGPDDEEDAEHKELRQRLNLKRAEDKERIFPGDTVLSNNKLKKRLKHPHKKFNLRQKLKFEACQLCPNPKGLKCEYCLCKSCCKAKASKEHLTCAGHNIKRKNVQEKEKVEAPTEEATIEDKRLCTDGKLDSQGCQDPKALQPCDVSISSLNERKILDSETSHVSNGAPHLPSDTL